MELDRSPVLHNAHPKASEPVPHLWLRVRPDQEFPSLECSSSGKTIWKDTSSKLSYMSKIEESNHVTISILQSFTVPRFARANL